MSPEHNSINWKEILRPKNIILNLLGVIFITLALKGFMLPNKFLDGGVIGLSMLLNEVTHVPFAALVLIFNMLFLFLGKQLLGKTFAIQSFITFGLISLFTYLININIVTSDPILIALFGGCLIGIGMGLCVRSGSIADGVEILALLITRKIGLNISEVIFAINTVLFLIAAWVFGITTALYSIVTYFAAIKSLEYIADGLEQYTALNIISSKSEEIKSLIVTKFGKGITVIKGERGYLPDSFDIKTDCDIIVTVVTRLELLRIKNEVSELDPKAFMFIQYIKEASGGILRYRKKH
ncbi:MAG: YitT family protein [Bacteroidota bacterium]